MLFSAVLIDFPNSKDCLKGEWSIDLGGLNNLKFSTMLFVVLNRLCFLLYEYRDLFIDMAVRNNRSKLAIANRHQER